MSFGPADLAASRRMKTTRVGGGHPGYRVIEDPDPDNPDAPRATAQQDPWHYSIARMVDACTSAGILPFYGPYGDIKDVEGCETQFRAAFLLGCVGAWSLHPVQIDIAKKVFSPPPDEVKFAKKVLEAIPDGARRAHDRRQDAGRRHLEAVQGDGVARGDAREEGPRAGEGVRAVRFFEYEAREIVKRAGIPVTQVRLRQDAPTRRARIADGHRRPDRDQVAGADRRAHEGRRREVRRHARRGRRARRGHPEARDQRPHAARRAGRLRRRSSSRSTTRASCGTASARSP